MSLHVGVFGGSFDPVHDAHVEVARRALRQIPCEEIWFLPAARAVHKPAGAEATADERARMLELVLADDDRLRLCRVELEHARPRFTVETLAELAATRPDARWYFLLGEDSFRALDSWHRPDELVRLATLVVAPRPGSAGPRPEEVYGGGVLWLEGEEIDLDSSAIRAELARGGSPGGLDPRVMRYIEEHGLYRGRSA